MGILKKIGEFIEDAYQGVMGALQIAFDLGVNIKEAVNKYGPTLRQHVRDAAEMVEALIPDGLPSSKLQTFDNILKWYIAKDKAIPDDITLDSPEVKAAVRLMLEAYLTDKKAKAVQ